MIRLTFIPESERAWYGVEGEDAASVLDQWNALPQWSVYDPADFRQRLVDLSGADVEMPAADDEVLAALAEAWPDQIRVEDGGRNAAMEAGEAGPKQI